MSRSLLVLSVVLAHCSGEDASTGQRRRATTQISPSIIKRPNAGQLQPHLPILHAAAPAPADAASGKLSRQHAQMLLVLAAGIYGTYPVLLRGLNVVGGEPLSSVFISCAR